MTSHKNKLTNCSNCGFDLGPDYEYCPSCGQENHDIKVPISHLGYEFVEGFTHFDTKILNTIKSMFTRPGLITQEYLEGKRAKYVPPPRFYIFISVIFFLLLGKLLDKRVEEELDKNVRDEKLYLKVKQGANEYRLKPMDWKAWLMMDPRWADSLLVVEKNPLSINHEELRDSVYQGLKKYWESSPTEKKPAIKIKDANDPNFDITYGDEKKEVTTDPRDLEALEINKSNAGQLAELDSIFYCNRGILKSNPYKVAPVLLGTTFTPREVESLTFASDAKIDSTLVKRGIEPNMFYRALIRRLNKFEHLELSGLIPTIVKAISASMFLLMPLIALLTMLFYRRYRKYYVEHLIFSIHMHSFLFTFYALLMIAGLILHSLIGGVVILVSLFGLWLYILFGIKRVFNESWFATTMKFLAINFIYSIISFFISLFAVGYGIMNF